LRERPEDIPELTERLLGKLCQSQGIGIPSISDEAKVYIQQLPFHGNVRELENMLERALALCDGLSITVEDLSLDEIPMNLNDKPVLPWNAPVTEPSVMTSTIPEPAFNDNRPVPSLANPSAGSTMLPMDISLSDYLEDIEKRTILQALEKTNNNKTAAAKLLGISFRTLRYRLSKLGLSKEQDPDLEEAEGDEE